MGMRRVQASIAVGLVWDGPFWEMCSVGFSLVFEFLFCWGILLSRVSFLFGAAQEKKPTNYKRSGGQRGWDLGFPALHRHHSGTGRKDTQNGKRCGNQ